MAKKLPAAFYNATTLFGTTLAVVMLILILLLFVIDAMAGFTNSYMGLLTYIALPGVMLFGLFLALVGYIRTLKRIKRTGAEAVLPVIDLNQPRHRFVLTCFGFGGLVLVALSGFGSYHAYEYTESVEFCGTTCHVVMKPEYTAYQNSPHAKVSCAQCHIGAGATWYVRSKLSGAYQVYSTIFNKYERPIKTPVANLRPAKETCEECHWPKHFYSQKLTNHSYFLADEDNTRHDVSMLVKIGGTESGMSEGIHAHMYLDNEVSYISTDRERQIIPYVEAKGPDGKVTIYRDTESKATEADLAKGEKRIVDCIDCHNRPTHIYRNPNVAVNRAMSRNMIDPKLPMIKSLAVEALEKPYKTEAEGLKGIESSIRDAYKADYADNPEATPARIDAAIAQVQDIFKKNYFPEMKMDWRATQDNLDHMHSSGCFRCHDDKHKSKEGRVISKNCNTCHTFMSQTGAPPSPKGTLVGQEFVHPMDIGDEWKTTPCKDCHGKPQEE